MDNDKIVKEILNLINSSKEPLETEDVVNNVQSKIKNASRTKVMYRLSNLRADGEISGKLLGAGKGVWVWWKQGLFSDSRRTKL